MKKLVLLLFVLVGLSTNAQNAIGGGLFLGNNSKALEINSEFSVADAITVSPSFDYYLGMPEGYPIMSLNLEGHYNLGDVEEMNYYPLAGISYLMASYSYEDVSGSVSTTAINLGGGLSYAVSDAVKLVGEVKYMMISGNGAVGFGVGALFNIGG